MKNLYEQLSKENKKKVELFKEQYPASGEQLVNELTEQYACTYITITVAIDLNTAISNNEPFDLIKFFKLFSDDI